MEPEVEDILRVGRVQRRYRQVRECRLAGTRHAGGLGTRIITDQRDGATGRVGAHQVRVTEGVGGAVETGRLAVPDAHHTVAAGRAGLAGQLAAHDGGCGELLVQPGLVDDVVLVQQRPMPGQLDVVPGERGSLIPRYERRGAKPVQVVVPRPVEENADESLDPGEVHDAFFTAIAIVQAEASAGRLRRRDG